MFSGSVCFLRVRVSRRDGRGPFSPMGLKHGYWCCLGRMCATGWRFCGGQPTPLHGVGYSWIPLSVSSFELLTTKRVTGSRAMTGS